MGQRVFTDTLREIRNGSLIDELTIELNRLVTAIQDTEKKGTLVLKLDISPVKHSGMVQIKDDIVVSPPKIPAVSHFYMTPEGNLELRDSRQPQLPGLHVAGEDEGSEKVDEETGEITKIS